MLDIALNPYVRNFNKTGIQQLFYLKISKEKIEICGNCDENKARDLSWYVCHWTPEESCKWTAKKLLLPNIIERGENLWDWKTRKCNEWFLTGLISTACDTWQHGKDSASGVSLSFNSCPWWDSLSAMKVDDIPSNRTRTLKSLISNFRILL